VSLLKKRWEYNDTAHQPFKDFMKTFDRKEVLYNVLIEFGIPLERVTIIEICLSETCDKARIGKHLSDIFPIQKSETKRCFIAVAFQFNFSIHH
jgi:hypothetical protein